MQVILTDGDQWFELKDAKLITVENSEFERLLGGVSADEITAIDVVSFQTTQQCPGCGSIHGACENASCVREDPRSLS
tara:strand:- start:4907 stop:5140 length:234 start_codon:yes stop_codon:yes gene_type:complete